MSRNDEPVNAGVDADGNNASAGIQPSPSRTPWPHSRAEAEMQEIIHALRGNRVLTLAQIKELCWASHWPGSDFTTALHRAIAAGEIKTPRRGSIRDPRITATQPPVTRASYTPPVGPRKPCMRS